ncbi:Chitinase B1 [Hyphodiscus hymeniophilus]|uniref:chitinase n=1 Tax=Hyphodiscus hymeniophilus TaxID=353542 RepID=A0A9P6VDT9_9HELO|nr:Chitinase B1 [Hyphodiscus hymeniophilus]
MLFAPVSILVSLMCDLAVGHAVHDRLVSNKSDVSNNATYPNYRAAAYFVNWRRADARAVCFCECFTHHRRSVHFPGDSWDEAGSNLYGCLKQLFLLKKVNRKLKVLLSIGGSSYSANFAVPASTDAGRSAFASSAVALVANLGLDGLDINWEYPQNDADAVNMVLLLKALRESLDGYGDSLSTPYRFQLTVASPAGASYYQTLHLADMDPHIDFWNLMAYDYAGGWSSVTANQANLFSSTSDATTTPFNTEDAIGYYIGKGITPNKIVLGMPIYGRSFAATRGLGQPFDGVGRGTWQAGVYDFKALPVSGANESYDNTTGSSYSYDAASKELVSYDNARVAKQKAAFIKRRGLGGAMWWESSADKVGSGSLIHNVVAVLGGAGGSGLEGSPNLLLYPNSSYDNLRSGMPDSGSAAETASSLPCSSGSMDHINRLHHDSFYHYQLSALLTQLFSRH